LIRHQKLPHLIDPIAHENQVKGLLYAQNLSDPDFFYMVADSAAMAVQYGKKDKLCTPMIEAVKNEEFLPEVI